MIDDLEKEGKKVCDFSKLDKNKLSAADKSILNNLENLIGVVNSNLEKYRFSDASDAIYPFMWHEVADKYIELVKGREDKETALAVLDHVLKTGLKLLHPFMPFITEAIWENISKGEKELLVSSEWPE
jgi:valyl-tRNA synthetase